MSLNSTNSNLLLFDVTKTTSASSINGVCYSNANSCFTSLASLTNADLFDASIGSSIESIQITRL